MNHEGAKGHEGGKAPQRAPRALRGCCGATPCGSQPAVPSRSEFLRARSVVIRRLRRLAKLGFRGLRWVLGGGRTRRFIGWGCALSKRASSGPTRLDPATLSPCEAYSLVFSRWSSVVSWGEGQEDLLDGVGQVPCIWSKTPR